MNLLARILSHGFAIAIVLLLAITLIYKGELFPGWELPEFLSLGTPAESGGADTGGSITLDTPASEPAVTREAAPVVTVPKEPAPVTAPPGEIPPEEPVAPVKPATPPVEPVPSGDSAESAAREPMFVAVPAASETKTQATAVTTAAMVPAATTAPAEDTTVADIIETAPAPHPVDASETPESVDAASRIVTEALDSAQSITIPTAIPEIAAPVTNVQSEPAETAASTDSIAAPEITSPAVPAAETAGDSDATPTTDAATSAESAMPHAVPLLPPVTATGEPPVQPAVQAIAPATAVPQAELTAPPPPRTRAPAGTASDETGTYQVLAAAREAYWLRDYATAEDKYRQLTAMDPDNPDGYGELGNMYFSQGMWELAASAYFEAGVRLVEEGQLEQAQQLVDVIRGLDGTQADELNKLIATAQATTQ